MKKGDLERCRAILPERRERILAGADRCKAEQGRFERERH